MLNAIRDCGSAAYLILFVFGLGLLVAAGALVTVVSRRNALPLAAGVCVVAIVALAIGLVAEACGRHAVDTTLSPVAVTLDPALQAAGYREAGMCRTVGMYAGGPLLLVGLALVAATYAVRAAASPR